MKLRIAGNSIRIRLLRSDVTALMETGHIEHTIHLTPFSFLRFALTHEADLKELEVRSVASEITVALPAKQARNWAETEQVGVYGTVSVGDAEILDVIVEKDFACLDMSDADNHDTFSNPQDGIAC